MGNEFIVESVAELFNHGRNWAVSVQHGNSLQFLFRIPKEVKTTERDIEAIGRRQYSDGATCFECFSRTL
jgi:hypothetical protein